MILVDTSVWIDHLRKGNRELAILLSDGEALCHTFVIGDLACGNLKNRRQILALLQNLPLAAEAEHEEVMKLIANHRLHGKGLGYIDAHLLASALLTHVPIWTLDKKLSSAAARIGVRF